MTYTNILSAINKFWHYSGIGEDWFRWLYYSYPYIFNFWQLICPFSWSCFLHWSVLLYTIISVYKWVHTDSNICFLFLFFSNLKQQFFYSQKSAIWEPSRGLGFCVLFMALVGVAYLRAAGSIPSRHSVWQASVSCQLGAEGWRLLFMWVSPYVALASSQQWIGFPGEHHMREMVRLN